MARFNNENLFYISFAALRPLKHWTKSDKLLSQHQSSKLLYNGTRRYTMKTYHSLLIVSGPAYPSTHVWKTNQLFQCLVSLDLRSNPRCDNNRIIFLATKLKCSDSEKGLQEDTSILQEFWFHEDSERVWTKF